ncbi:MAG: hypothetical protein EX272_11600 [Chromatiales bacterium]|nr:MAG: hypothetical protein EX272_11600 [Chromatiales bacterium]
MKNKNALASALALSLLIVSQSVCAEVIVTGSKRSVDTASPVTVIDREDIENSSLVNLEDIIRQMPGVSSPQFTPGGTATIDIRGFRPDSSLTLVDGIRIESGRVDLNTIPTHLLERVEVLRGPQGTLFGSAGSSGAVNVVTRPEFKPNNPLGSYVLDGLKVDLSDLWFAYDSKDDCDETHGSPMPLWTYNPDTLYGGPFISKGGDFWAWGDLKYGYEPPSLYTPAPSEQYIPEIDYSLLQNEGQFTYNEFNKLRARIRDYPGVLEKDKSDYIFSLFFGTLFSGFGSLSDDAVKTGKFDADATFDDFLEFSRDRTDADRAVFERGPGSLPFYPYAGAEDIPAVPAAGSDTPAAPPAPEPAPTPTATLGPRSRDQLPAPFNNYVYPPDYSFDWSKCDDEVKDEDGNTQKGRMLGYLDARGDARAEYWSLVDFTRSAAARAEDADKIADADRRLKENNAQLLAEWENCLKGIATPPQLAAAEDTEYSLGVGTAFSDKFNLKVHFEYADQGDDAPTGPVPGLAGDLNLFDKPDRWVMGEPIWDNKEKDVETGAGSGSSTEYSDDTGTMTFPGAINGTYLSTKMPDLGLGYDEGMAFDIGARYGYGAVKRAIGKDWDIYVDYDPFKKRGGPSIGLRVPYVKQDSVYLETIPGYNAYSGTSDATENYQSELFNTYGTDYFSIGGKNFYAFTYPEFGGFDFNLLGKERGATYWANNECGESALPPEGSGYLTASESPVKRISDQWAFRHIGLSGDEPTLDEFAKPVVVAIIDTGLDWHHLDFSWDNLWRNENEIPGNGLDDDNNGYVDDIIGWSFIDNRNHPWDNDGHGTAVAGIIAATQGNSAGIDGINGNAKIMVLKALNNFGRTRATHVAKAIVYAADNGAQLINLSVTGPGFPKVVQDAVDYAAEKGALVINASGNEAENIDTIPGILRNVVTVAATGSDNRRAVFSNYGNAVDISAPGIDVVSLRARGTDFMYNSADTSYVKEDAFLGDDRRYYRSTGTSFAAPIVTGIASLVLANNPGLKPAELKRVLEQSARDIEAPGFDRLTGFGIVDAKAALAADPSFYIYAGIGDVQPITVDGQTFLEAFGTAAADQLASARLEIGQGQSPTSWKSVGGVFAEGVNNGSLGQIPIDSMAGGGTWTIRLLVRHANGSERENRYVIDL